MKNKTTEHFDYFYEHYSPKSNKDYKKELLKHKRIAEYNLYQHEKYNLLEVVAIIVAYLSIFVNASLHSNDNACFWVFIVVAFILVVCINLCFYSRFKTKAGRYKAEILAIEQVIDELT